MTRATAASPRDLELLRVGRHQVRITHPDKVLYPRTAMTKADVVAYYLRIAPFLLPHIKGRALTLKRYPLGVSQKHFYEKTCPSHKPDWVRALHVRSSGKGFIDYCAIDDVAGLLWAVNLTSLEIHPLLSEEPDFDRPTMLVFDLDPGAPANIIDAARVALRVRDTFADLGLQSFVKTSGNVGIHLAIPLNTPNVTFADTKPFARAVAEVMERSDPQHIISEMSKSLRPGKVFIDWSQNDRHKTTCSVYSLRAKSDPIVSTPLEWSELERAVRKNDPAMLRFETDEVLERVRVRGDLWQDVLKKKQKLPRVG
jgi:bifunctional non-homologous end joining protein LigD